MITDTPDGQTNYCQMCEDMAKELAQLKQREMVLVAELQNIAEAKRFNKEHFDDDRAFADWAQSRARHTLNLAPSQTAAQALRLHVEYMMTLPVAARLGNNHSGDVCIAETSLRSGLNQQKYVQDAWVNSIPLFAIPPLPESKP